MPTILVAYQGAPGAYSEAAGRELFGSAADNIQLLGHPTFEACFEAVTGGKCTYAMLPMENTMGGSVADNFDLQLKYNLHAVAELNKRISHSLLALPGTKKEDLRLVASHPQALSQCAHYIETQLPWAKPQVEADTAGSAKKIAEEKLRGWGALCSKHAAAVYGLEVLDEDVQDAKDNITRFLLFSTRPLDLSRAPPDLALKCSLVFSIGDHAGALHRALTSFAMHNVDLTKLESRPDRRRGASPSRSAGALLSLFGADYLQNGVPAYADEAVLPMDEGKFKALFFLDLNMSPGVRDAVRELASIAPFVRVLGVYPAGGPLLDHVARSVGLPEVQAGGSAPKRPRSAPTGLRIAIVGFGNFGQFLAKHFVANRHAVSACSRSDHGAAAEQLGVAFFKDLAELVAQQDPQVVVLAPSILSFAAVAAGLDPALLRGRLVVDVLSVKVHARQTMLSLWPDERVDILCTHPMFGPESGRYTWRGLPFVYEQTRVKDTARAMAFVDIFRQAGCRVVEMSCAEHDAKAANSQFVTHFTGRSLNELHLVSTGIDTKGFASLLELVENTCKDSDDLFVALFRHNPAAAATLDSLRLAVEGVAQRLSAHAQNPQRLADALNRVRPSKTVRTHAQAMELAAKGADIITTLTVGEPHFGPPEEALQAAEKCLRLPKGTKYTAVGGTPELRKAIAADYALRKGVSYEPGAEVLVSGGGKQSIFQAVHALCGPGDEVVIPAPFWVSYPDICLLAGAKPVLVQRDPDLGYILRPDQLRAACNSRTRLFILNNPCNPTGCLYARADLEALAAVLREPAFAHVLVLSDEIYERVVFDGAEHVAFAALPGMRDRTLTVNGVAKGFAMTGMRIGWLCGPSWVVRACEKLQGQISSCACSVSQAAAAAALPLDPNVAGPGKANLESLRSNRELAFGLLKQIPGLVAVKGGGAFYAYCSLPGLGLTGEQLCERLITRVKGVAFVPGEAFGSSPESCSFRMSYAADPKHVEEGVRRLAAFVEEFRAATG